MTSIGSYTSIADRQNKMTAYKKLLTARSNINRMSEAAFIDKVARGDSPYIPSPVERKDYATTEEEQADLNRQEQLAVQKVKEVLPLRDDALKFVMSTLGPRTVTSDPLQPIGSAPTTMVALLNRYWARFSASVLKGIRNLTPIALNRLWLEYLDSLEEDLLPKEKTVQSIRTYLADVEAKYGPTGEVNTIRDMLSTMSLSESQLNNIYSTIKDAKSTPKDIEEVIRPISGARRKAGVALPSKRNLPDEIRQIKNVPKTVPRLVNLITEINKMNPELPPLTVSSSDKRVLQNIIRKEYGFALLP